MTKKMKKYISGLLVFLNLTTTQYAMAMSVSDKKNNQDNIAPTASFSTVVKKKVDVIVLTDYTGEKLGRLQNAISEFKASHAGQFDIRTQVSDNLPKMDIGTQDGTFNKSVYGIVGKASYLESGYNPYITWSNVPKEFKVCLNPIVKMPGEAPPTGSVIVPSNVSKQYRTFNYGYQNAERKEFDIYTFSGSVTYVPYANPFDTYLSNLPQWNCTWLFRYGTNYNTGGSYSVTPTPSTLKFNFEPAIAFYDYETHRCTNTVKAWNLSQNELAARQDSKAFYVIATDKASTDFYSSSIYNATYGDNYMFGNLRSDNLGKYVKDSNAVVLASADSSSLDINLGNVIDSWDYANPIYDGSDDDGSIRWKYNPIYKNEKYKMSFAVDMYSSLQNMTLNQLITQNASDYRIFDKTDVDGAGLIERIDHFIQAPGEKVDLVIATDKDSATTDAFESQVRSNAGAGVDIKTFRVDAANKTVVGQRIYRSFKDNFLFKSGYVRVGDRFNNLWYSLGDLNQPETAANIVNWNVQDMGNFEIRDNYNTYANGQYVIDAEGNFYTNNSRVLDYNNSRGNFKFQKITDAGSRYNGYYQLICPYRIKEFKSYFLRYYTGGSSGHTALCFLTEDNRVIVLHYTWNPYSYLYAQVEAASNVKHMLIKDEYIYCITYSGDIYNWRYDPAWVAKRELPRKITKNNVVLSQDNKLYTFNNYLSGGTPLASNVADLAYDNQLNRIDYTTYDGKFSYSYTYESGRDDNGDAIYSTVLQERTVPLGPAVKATTDSEAANKLIKITDHSVVRQDKNGDFLDTNYEDFRYFEDSESNFLIDTDGNVTIKNRRESVDKLGTKLNSAIASQIVTEKTINVESISTAAIKSAALRPEADKIFVYLSDQYRYATGLGFGTYYPWAGLNQDTINYLQDNRFAVYFVTPKQAMGGRFSPPYIRQFTQEKTINDLYSGKVKDSLRFDKQEQFIAFFGSRYPGSVVEDPNAIYLVQGEDKLSYSILYDDYEKDPMNALRWRFTHDPNVFENNQGLNPSSGQWLSNFNEEPYQVGKYVIECQAQDKPTADGRFTNYWLWGNVSQPTKVYVHRRPVADYQIMLSKSGTGYNTIIEDNSYDLDRLSTQNKGIVSWKWKYRPIGSTEWIYGQLPSYLDKGLVYEVSLEVLDRQGAWSKPAIRTVDTTKVNLTPLVDADPKSAGWTNQNINVTVTADDNGENDFSRVSYTTTTGVTEPGYFDGTMYQKSFPLTYSAEGSWYLHMRVWDNAGNTSYRYRGPYMIDKTPPGGTATPYSHAWTNQDVSVSFAPWDNLSGVKQWRYRTSDNDGASYGAWSGYAWGPTAGTINFTYQGLHRIQAEVIDNAGNVNYVNSGTYLIDKVAPVITANPPSIPENIGPVTVNVSVTDNLSGVRETKYCWTQSADKPLSSWQSTANGSFPTVQDQEGTWYLHLEAWDNAGNSSYSCVGSYTVIYIEMYDFTVTMIQDTAWRDYYFDGKDTNGDGGIDIHQPRGGTDIKTPQMPVNYSLNGYRPVNYPVESVKAGVKVKFYIRARGAPDSLIMKPRYLLENGSGITHTEDVVAVNKVGEMWCFEWIIPLETKQGSFVCFDVLATKNGKQYGNSCWKDTWQMGNTSNAVFYILGNALKDLKYNQSH